ncbi:hypothetical protein GCM10010365_75780 [Streptomyces poonensis]|uniref:Uncharacterized protein n=1 Tax=Streptomyces poonensis TaxID=68255 RepID=A0A918QED9_9ACTN|nr:hypothetical protein GCM10010365_75780 [Streptomyces poonensis]GLJ88191.1 hypothetical protein GCM10017589_07910 [Streptomyces poonensis]
MPGDRAARFPVSALVPRRALLVRCAPVVCSLLVACRALALRFAVLFVLFLALLTVLGHLSCPRRSSMGPADTGSSEEPAVTPGS